MLNLINIFHKLIFLILKIKKVQQFVELF